MKDEELEKSAHVMLDKFPKMVDDTINHVQMTALTGAMVGFILVNHGNEEQFYAAKIALKKLKTSLTTVIEQINATLKDEFESFGQAKEKEKKE